MSDRSEMEPLDPDLAALFRSERVAPLPTGSEARVLAGIVGRLAASPVLPPGGDLGAASGPGGSADAATLAPAAHGAITLSTAKVVALALLSAAAGAVVGIAADRQLTRAPGAATSSAAMGFERAPPPLAPEVVPPPAPAPPRAVAPGPPSRPVPARRAIDPGARPLEEESSPELLLIDRARVALRRGLVEEALIDLMQHERQFGRGRLAEERDVLLIEAYVARSDRQLAARRIERYRREHPRGFLRGRVERAEAAIAE